MKIKNLESKSWQEYKITVIIASENAKGSFQSLGKSRHCVIPAAWDSEKCETIIIFETSVVSRFWRDSESIYRWNLGDSRQTELLHMMLY